MDPSEFEGTLEKDEDALTGGRLEALLGGPTFEPLDLTREIDEVHLSVYNLTEALATWQRVGFGALLQVWDEQAVHISDNKESQVAGRKVLAGKVRAFTSAYLSSPEELERDPWRAEGNDLITTFKAQFDALTSNSRFAETAFLSTYKLMTTAEDPALVIDKCIKVCILAQEALKTAQERLNTAEAIILRKQAEGDNAIGFGLLSSKDAAAQEREKEAREKQSAREKEEMEIRHAAELADLRTRFELELRTREQNVRSDLERSQLELQQHFEGLLERKEAQVSSLLATVSDTSQRAIEAEERGISLQQEVTKRRELEERLRASMTEVADLRLQAREAQTKSEDAFTRCEALEAQLEREAKKAAHDLDLLTSERSALREASHALEEELALRPPADLRGLAEALGMDLPEGRGGEDGAKSRRTQWGDVESFVKESVRRSASAAAEARAAELEASQRLATLEAEAKQLRAAVEFKDSEMAGLERDLVAAQRMAESNKALLKASLPVGSAPGPALDVSEELRAASLSPAKAPAPQSTFFQTRASVSASSSSSSSVSGQGLGAAGDLERGSGGAGTAALLAEASDGSDRMLQAIQSQRDRFMKQARDKENELNAFKARYDKLHEEQLTLRADNLELYRRQRLLRAGSLASGGGADEATSPSKAKARRDVRSVNDHRHPSGGSGGSSSSHHDALEAKYTKLYEAHIDPFKFEEADRAVVISRLNPLERALANVSRFLMQDRWTRHALMVYLLLVHLFAVGYVAKILNPQIVDEIDWYSKAKWSRETLDTFEIEPDRRR